LLDLTPPDDEGSCDQCRLRMHNPDDEAQLEAEFHRAIWPQLAPWRLILKHTFMNDVKVDLLNVFE